MSKVFCIGHTPLSNTKNHFRTKTSRCVMCGKTARREWRTCDATCQARYENSEKAREARLLAQMGKDPSKAPDWSSCGATTLETGVESNA